MKQLLHFLNNELLTFIIGAYKGRKIWNQTKRWKIGHIWQF